MSRLLPGLLSASGGENSEDPVTELIGAFFAYTRFPVVTGIGVGRGESPADSPVKSGRTPSNPSRPTSQYVFILPFPCKTNGNTWCVHVLIKLDIHVLYVRACMRTCVRWNCALLVGFLRSKMLQYELFISMVWLLLIYTIGLGRFWQVVNRKYTTFTF